MTHRFQRPYSKRLAREQSCSDGQQDVGRLQQCGASGLQSTNNRVACSVGMGAIMGGSVARGLLREAFQKLKPNNSAPRVSAESRSNRPRVRSGAATALCRRSDAPPACAGRLLRQRAVPLPPHLARARHAPVRYRARCRNIWPGWLSLRALARQRHAAKA